MYRFTSLLIDRNSNGLSARRTFSTRTPCRIWAIWVNCAGMSVSYHAAAVRWPGATRCIQPVAPITLVAVVAVVACVSASRPASGVDPADLARRAGLRVVGSAHLTLITDRPERAGDGVGDLPRLFDEAVSTWTRHYRLDAERVGAWRATGCLIVDRDRFRAAGLLPTDGSVPDFENGFCLAERFWMMDQSNPAYRRHLLFHEGVHAFTVTLLRATAPAWYTEGIAEYLATHRLQTDPPASPRFVAMPLPERPADVEQLGRIERIAGLRRERTMPSLAQIFDLPTRDHRDLGAYASSWAAVAFLSGHPAFREAFHATELQPLDGRLTTRLRATADWDGLRADRDFDAFVADLDYGYDFARMAIDWSPGGPLVAEQHAAAAADRGWQNTGWSLAKGDRCSFTATGRVTVGPASARPLESEGDGITLRWYRGRPVGRLLIAQWVEPADGGRPSFQILAQGASGTCAAAADGPLYVKVNESPGDLADNAGAFTVFLTPR